MLQRDYASPVESAYFFPRSAAPAWLLYKARPKRYTSPASPRAALLRSFTYGFHVLSMPNIDSRRAPWFAILIFIAAWFCVDGILIAPDFGQLDIYYFKDAGINFAEGLGLTTRFTYGNPTFAYRDYAQYPPIYPLTFGLYAKAAGVSALSNQLFNSLVAMLAGVAGFLALRPIIARTVSGRSRAWLEPVIAIASIARWLGGSAGHRCTHPRNTWRDERVGDDCRRTVRAHGVYLAIRRPLDCPGCGDRNSDCFSPHVTRVAAQARLDGFRRLHRGNWSIGAVTHGPPGLVRRLSGSRDGFQHAQ
jgi:hypothetical protein